MTHFYDEQQPPGQQYGPASNPPPAQPPLRRSSGRQESEYGRQHRASRSSGDNAPQQAPGQFATPPPQRPQEPMILTSQPYAQEQVTLPAYTPPAQAEAPVENAQSAITPQARGAVLRSSHAGGALDNPTDFALTAGAIFMIVAVLVAFFVLLSVLHSPLADPQLLARLLIGAILYAGCVFAGILWGRYQSNTQAIQDNVSLRQDNERLRTERDAARGEARALRAAASSRSSGPAYPAGPNDYSYGRSSLISEPEQIKQQQPLARIYDVARDPEGYTEQEQRTFPHEKTLPNNGMTIKLAQGWQAIGASRRGYGHSYEGKFREDDFNIVQYQLPGLELLLVAIADGVSSRANSRHGARAAVLGATKNIDSRLLMTLATALTRRGAQPDYQTAAQDILIHCLHMARQAVEGKAQRLHLAVDELQSTLMVFLVVPLAQQQLLVASAQVGDGVLFALQPQRGSAPRDQWSYLQRPQIQTFGNEVQPFMTTGPEFWTQYLQVAILEGVSFLMGMTDGTADDIEPPVVRTTQTPELDPFFYIDDFYKRISIDAVQTQRPAAELVKFLSYKKKGSTDDRTVVCLYR